MNVIRLSEHNIKYPGRNTPERQALADEHGDLWFIVGVHKFTVTGAGTLELESVASGQRAWLTLVRPLGRTKDPQRGATLQLIK